MDRAMHDEEKAPEFVDWWAAAAASEDSEYLANFWFSREEATVTLGSKWFDADLNPLDRASDDAALEVRLILLVRDEHAQQIAKVRCGRVFLPACSLHCSTLS